MHGLPGRVTIFCWIRLRILLWIPLRRCLQTAYLRPAYRRPTYRRFVLAIRVSWPCGCWGATMRLAASARAVTFRGAPGVTASAS